MLIGDGAVLHSAGSPQLPLAQLDGEVTQREPSGVGAAAGQLEAQRAASLE